MKRHNPLRLLSITLTVMALIWLGMPPAVAAPPPNDDFDSATIVTEPLPFTDETNTVEATTAPDDPNCVGQGPTVWYSFTPSVDMRIQAKTFGSDYDTTLSVYTGTRGNLTQIACNDDAGGTLQSSVAFDAVAGQTFFFMVGAFASGPGGNLVFTVEVAPPPLTIDLSIDSVGSFDRTGNATIRGTVTCSKSTFVDLFGELKQEAGRFFIRGFFGTSFACNGETPWEVTVSGENGSFAGGPTKASANAFASDPDTGEFVQDSASAIVRLRGSR
jgi:hypothetical protein